MARRSLRTHHHETRRLTILAQDPSVMRDGIPLLVDVDVPMEDLAPGPRGYRVHVIDYDASTGYLYPPGDPPGLVPHDRNVGELLDDPAFHAQNAYAVVMRTLARFEFALGRRVPWSFGGHQLHVAPHAFTDANAFYSKRDRGLFFGYFTTDAGRKVFTCLAHDIVAHETTHALLDGLREHYSFPSSPDQAAFHEGFGDIVALLSVFSLVDVVERLLDLGLARKAGEAAHQNGRTVELRWLTAASLRNSALFGLGEEIGLRMPGRSEAEKRLTALRRSAALDPKTATLSAREFIEAHSRGEIFVAAMMNSFLAIWLKRIARLAAGGRESVDRRLVAEEGAQAANQLLTMAIRALDYAPPTDLLFADYLSALLTADLELQPDDTTYHYRNMLRHTFGKYGIEPASRGSTAEPGIWNRADASFDYSRSHFESLQRDPEEVFRFVWQNRVPLGLHQSAYTRVESVRPCVRLSPDGFTLMETVALYIQMLTMSASELEAQGVTCPRGMPGDRQITLFGGGALVFNEFGQLKYHIHNSVLNPRKPERQIKRLQCLWDSGFFDEARSARQPFAELHRQRILGQDPGAGKENTHASLF